MPKGIGTDSTAPVESVPTPVESVPGKSLGCLGTLTKQSIPGGLSTYACGVSTYGFPIYREPIGTDSTGVGTEPTRNALFRKGSKAP